MQRLPDGAYVLCWMQRSQRADYNHALEYAVTLANQLNQPVVRWGNPDAAAIELDQQVSVIGREEP